MNNTDRERMIDRYVLGRMDETELRDFEDMMQADEELRNEVVFVQMVKESLARREANLQKIKTWENAATRQETYGMTGTMPTRSDGNVSPTIAVPDVSVRTIRWKMAVSAVAACLLLFIGMSYPYSYRGLQDSDFHMGVKGSLSKVADLLEDKKYSDALELIESSLADCEAALSDTIHKDYVCAQIDYLEWARIQTLLKMREFERAYEEVALFREDAGRYKEKADRLYKKLKIRLRK